MQPQELLNLIAQPESDVLEFKTSIPSPELTARLLSAFANTKGGTLVVGVTESTEGNKIVGVDELEHIQKLLEQANERISPLIAIHSEFIHLEDKSILVVTIPKGQSFPYFVEGQAFHRFDDRIVPLSLFAPDVHNSAYEAVTSGSGAVAQGRGAVAAGDQGVAVGRSVTDSITIAKPDYISYRDAFERVVGSTAFVLNQLELSYRQAREQSQGWFRFSLIAAMIGLALIVIGMLTLIFGTTTAGMITAISSVVPDVAAALFFVQSRSANERVDVIQKRLTDAREIQSAVEIVNTIDDPPARDKLKAEIVRKALRIK
jgi:Putative DNA-binding domain